LEFLIQLAVEAENGITIFKFRVARSPATGQTYQPLPPTLMSVAGKIIEGKKLKLSLCLTKHHTVKMYWDSGDIAPRILDVGTRWRLVVSFTP
jgi:hypothetical protein